MSHFNEIVVKTAKIKNSTIEDVKTSLAEHYPLFKLQDIKESKSEWEATLLREISAKEMAKMAALPFEEKEDEDEFPEEPDLDSKDSPEDDESEEKSEDKSKGDSDKSKGGELEHIEELLMELKDKVIALQDKANVVDDIHETTKPHIEGPDDRGDLLPRPEEIGPTAQGGGNPMGAGMPGKKPPMAPPMASSKIAYASIQQDGLKFSMAEIVDAMQEKYPRHDVVDIKKDLAKNRYVAKLELKK